MKTLGGIGLGLAIWAVIFVIFPRNFLGLPIGRPFETLPNGDLYVEPWTVLMMILGFFALPYFGVKALHDRD